MRGATCQPGRSLGLPVELALGFLHAVEDAFRRHVPGDLAQLRIARRRHVQPLRQAVTSFHQPRDLVLGEQADLQVEVGALVGAVAMRFWLIRTKVERKIASTEATIARTTKDGSNFGTPGASRG